MSTATEVIAVVTQVDRIIDEMVVFTDNEKAEKHFADAITTYANDWGVNQEEMGMSDDIYSISQTEVNIAIENGYWQMGDTMFTLVHSSNTLNVCACGTK
ncbi:MAG: hypothetical protein DRJ64_07315 [Thermoprotei archaeon]|nr:MAG: hypothetical protein DRJ64_07315 [Thermoprotei archaeon]